MHMYVVAHTVEYNSVMAITYQNYEICVMFNFVLNVRMNCLSTASLFVVEHFL